MLNVKKDLAMNIFDDIPGSAEDNLRFMNIVPDDEHPGTVACECDDLALLHI